jgi:hypothetical protein
MMQTSGSLFCVENCRYIFGSVVKLRNNELPAKSLLLIQNKRSTNLLQTKFKPTSKKDDQKKKSTFSIL